MEKKLDAILSIAALLRCSRHTLRSRFLSCGGGNCQPN